MVSTRRSASKPEEQQQPPPVSQPQQTSEEPETTEAPALAGFAQPGHSIKTEESVEEPTQPQQGEDLLDTAPNWETTETNMAMKEEQPSDISNDDATTAPVAEEDGNNTEASAETSAADLAAAAGMDLSKYAENPIFERLTGQGLEARLAGELIELFEKGSMCEEDVDERAMEMLRAMRPEHACFVIQQVRDASLIGVQNRASYLMAVMRNFRDRLRQMGPQAATAQPLITGPDPDSIKAVLDKSGYPLEVTVGQRKYGGPPPNWEGGPPSGPGFEIYVGHIPKDMYEDSLIPVFEDVGQIWDLRLMMDPMTGHNRGYAFITYATKEAAQAAAKKYDGFEIKTGKSLRVNVSVANTRLFLGNIPKSKTKDEILQELKNCTEGIKDVIVYMNPDSTDQRRNRGFCFADFEDHKGASDAKRKLSTGRLRPWNCDLVVDWAEAQEEPDDETMSKVKVLYVRNLKEEVTEEVLKEAFEMHGEVERVKKVKDYAFVHYAERESALKALHEVNGHEFSGLSCEISLAKPQVDKQKRDRMRAERERRTFGRGRGGPQRGYDDFYGPPPGWRGGRGSRSRGGGGGYGGGSGMYGGQFARGYGAQTQDYYGYGGGYDEYYRTGGYGYEDYAAYGYGQAAAAYGGGYDDYGYGGYDDYGYASAPAYTTPPRGARAGGTGGGRGFRGGNRGGNRGMGGGGGGGRGRGRSGGAPKFGRGQKRPGEGGGGPASKRGNYGGGDYWGGHTGGQASGGTGHSEQDFSMDVNMTSF